MCGIQDIANASPCREIHNVGIRTPIRQLRSLRSIFQATRGPDCLGNWIALTAFESVGEDLEWKDLIGFFRVEKSLQFPPLPSHQSILLAPAQDEYHRGSSACFLETLGIR